MAGHYASISDIQARLPGRPISMTSSPSSTDIERWIDQAEAMLDGALLAAELDAPYTDESAVLILAAWVSDYVEGRTRIAHASASGDGTNKDGQDMVAAFEKRLEEIPNRPGLYGSMLGAGTAPTASIQVRGANSDGCREPTFTRSETF